MDKSRKVYILLLAQKKKMNSHTSTKDMIKTGIAKKKMRLKIVQHYLASNSHNSY